MKVLPLLKELIITYINKTSSFHDSSGSVKTCCQNFLLEVLSFLLKVECNAARFGNPCAEGSHGHRVQAKGIARAAAAYSCVLSFMAHGMLCFLDACVK